MSNYYMYIVHCTCTCRNQDIAKQGVDQDIAKQGVDQDIAKQSVVGNVNTIHVYMYLASSA